MQLIAQILVIVLVTVNFLGNLYIDVNGRKAKEPKGFEGIISTLLATAIIITVYYFAGAFNLIF